MRHKTKNNETRWNYIFQQCTTRVRVTLKISWKGNFRLDDSLILSLLFLAVSRIFGLTFGITWAISLLGFEL